ncbi:MAG: DUF3800 domain-containing protein [Demequinaceae bacterium]|nr:DUF3800 domain-containing protein [Demequinaceae bacterium]
MAYVDESYDASHFVLAVLLVDGPAAERVNNGLDAVVARARTSYGVPPAAEIHAHAVATGKGAWMPLRASADDRVKVLAEVVDVIAASGARILTREVRPAPACPPFTTAATVDSTYQVALAAVSRHVQAHCERSGEYAVLIADEVADEDHHRRHLADLRVGAGAPSSEPCLNRIVDALHFGPSHASRLLQAVDVVAYVTRRVGSPLVRSDRALDAACNMARQLDRCRLQPAN